jgi:hypothetical protein
MFAGLKLPGLSTVRLIALAAGLVLAASVGTAEAGSPGSRPSHDCGCNPPPPPPPPPPCGCNPPPPPSGGGGVNVKVYVNTSASSSSSSSSGASSSAMANAVAGLPSAVSNGTGGGGWAGYGETAPAAGFIQNLQVEDVGDQALDRVSVQKTRRSVRRVIVQAACLDDRGMPHPASQVSPDREVAETYEGELFRCIAGTRLQATWGDYQESLKLEHGEIIACDKLQALWRSADGALTCKAQKPARDCNERSLLRRYGVGVKVMTLVREETYTETREAERVRASAAGLNLTLDGGVGGFH